MICTQISNRSITLYIRVFVFVIFNERDEKKVSHSAENEEIQRKHEKDYFFSFNSVNATTFESQ